MSELLGKLKCPECNVLVIESNHVDYKYECPECHVKWHKDAVITMGDT